jgi:nitrogen regulatory protein PII
MKFVMICYNEAIDNEVIELLDNAGVAGYTKWTKVLGKGETSGPHLYSHIWPKANNVLFTAMPEETAVRLLEDIRKMKKEVGAEGLKAFMWQINEVT